MARFEINPDWQPLVLADWRELADGQLGAEVADDARRYCPVRTGALKASIRHGMEGDDLIVSATGGGEDNSGNLYVSHRPGRLTERSARAVHPSPGRNQGSLTTREVHHVHEGGRAYALFVEMPHRIFHPSTNTAGPEMSDPNPFLRPALYKRRGG